MFAARSREPVCSTRTVTSPRGLAMPTAVNPPSTFNGARAHTCVRACVQGEPKKRAGMGDAYTGDEKVWP